LLSTADVGLVIIPPEEGSETAIPSKIYEYMAAGMYTLVLAEQDSAVARLVRELHLGEIVPQRDSTAIATALCGLLRRFESESLKPSVGPEVLRRFSRAEHARQLAEVFDSVYCRMNHASLTS
jgi:glycosyltransferase involved in cell wall biosynthesis